MDWLWLTIFLVGISIALLYWWSTSKFNYWATRNVPYIKPIPFFGNMAPTFFRKISITEHFENMYKQLKQHKIGGIYEFSNPMVLVTDPELVRDITVKNFDHFHDRRVITGQLTDPLFVRSLLMLKGAEWREMRNRLSPAFTTSKLRAMLPLIERCCKQFAKYLMNRSDARSEAIEFKSAFTRFTNDVIATVAFGYDVNAIDDPENIFYKNAFFVATLVTFKGIRMLVLFGYMMFPKLMQFLGIPFIPKSVTKFFQNLVNSAINHRVKSGMTRPDLLQLLMAAQKDGIVRAQDDEQDVGSVGEDEKAFQWHKKHLTVRQGDRNLITEDDVASQAFLFFFAGFETVSSMMSFMAHLLAVNPDVQEKLRAEIDETMQANGGKLTYESIHKMQYLDMVISESLRLYPPVGFTDRNCVKTYKVPNSNMVIEEGVTVFIPMYAMQHDPDHFPDPERFDPERFSEEKKTNIRPYTYLPFGTGPHNCIGMRLALLEVKMCTSYMLAVCELQVCSKTEIPLQLSKESFNLTANAGFWINAIPREKPSIII